MEHALKERSVKTSLDQEQRSTAVLIWKGEDLRDPTSRERNLSDSYSLKGKELAPSRHESPYGCPMQSGYP